MSGDVPNNYYLIDEFAADLSGGHNVVATVFNECLSMYRASGPVEMRPVGETDFANGIAAMSASGQYGPTKIAAGIVGFADLTLGAKVEPVLRAHIAAGGGRFGGIRYGTARDGIPIPSSATATQTRGPVCCASPPSAPVSRACRPSASLSTRWSTILNWTMSPTSHKPFPISGSCSSTRACPWDMAATLASAMKSSLH